VPANPLWSELEWRGPHPGYLGGLLRDQPVLIRRATLVAFITNIRVYPEGISFTARVVQATEEGLLSSNEPVVAVGFADGRSWKYDPDMRGDFLIPGGSQQSYGPGGASWDADYWLPFLPADGRVTFSISVGETTGSAFVDATTVLAATSRAIDLWEEPEA